MARASRDDGLTLIELLVVITIIGVLSAIAIPELVQHRKKGYRAAATRDLKNAATAIETFASDYDGNFSLVNGADEDSAVLRDQGFNRSEWLELDVIATANTYCLRGRHEEFPSSLFVYRNSTGVVEVGPLGELDCV